MELGYEKHVSSIKKIKLYTLESGLFNQHCAFCQQAQGIIKSKNQSIIEMHLRMQLHWRANVCTSSQSSLNPMKVKCTRHLSCFLTQSAGPRTHKRGREASNQFRSTSRWCLSHRSLLSYTQTSARLKKSRLIKEVRKTSHHRPSLSSYMWLERYIPLMNLCHLHHVVRKNIHKPVFAWTN